jgi:hypothetical protein
MPFPLVLGLVATAKTTMVAYCPPQAVPEAGYGSAILSSPSARMVSAAIRQSPGPEPGAESVLLIEIAGITPN